MIMLARKLDMHTADCRPRYELTWPQPTPCRNFPKFLTIPTCRVRARANWTSRPLGWPRVPLIRAFG